MADAKSTFTIETKSNAAEILAKDTAAAVDFENEIERLSRKNSELIAAQKSLVGSSDEVKAARQKIGVAIKSNVTDIGKMNLALIKRGELKDTRKATPDLSKLSKASELVSKKLESATASSSGFSGSMLMMAGPAGVAATAAIVVVGVIAKLTIGLVKSTIALADNARNARLHREAIMGSAQQAEVLDHWHQRLTETTGIAGATIEGYSTALSKARLSGKEYTAALEATTIAQAAMGDSLSGKVQELTTRYARMGVFTLGRFELDGTGLQTADVAAALAKNTKVSLADAQRALVSGRLPLVKGAEAIREAIKTKFGKNIAEKAISIDSLKNKAEAKLGQFAKGVNIDKLLLQADKLLEIFDSNTVAGKTFMSAVNNTIAALAKGAEVVVPGLITSFESAAYVVALIENKATKVYVVFQRISDVISEMYNGGGGLAGITNALDNAEKTGRSITANFVNATKLSSGIKPRLLADKAGSLEIPKLASQAPANAARAGFASGAQAPVNAARVGSSSSSPAPANVARVGAAASPAAVTKIENSGNQHTFNINVPVQSNMGPEEFQKPAFKQALIKAFRESLAQGVG